MNQETIRILLLGLLLLLVIFPFAGLAPLLLVVLIAGAVSLLWSIAKVLLVGRPAESEKNT